MTASASSPLPAAVPSALAPDRKTLIADTALALLASVGARGLTHRAVDAQAGLPLGSTSFYCRTRFDLLALALGRHASLDRAELEEDGLKWRAGQPSLARLIDSLAHRIEDWLSPAKRARLMSRVELFLIASREPELGALIAVQRQRFLDGTVLALRHAGVAEPERLAPALVMTVDGILFGHIASGQARLSIDDCRAMLWRALGAGPRP